MKLSKEKNESNIYGIGICIAAIIGSWAIAVEIPHPKILLGAIVVTLIAAVKLLTLIMQPQ